MRPTVRIATAGWSIPGACSGHFPGDGPHLIRYARIFSAVEINSSFHRPHRRTTYERWAAAVPPGFRFSVKLPKAISHKLRLVAADDLIAAFAAEVAGLAERLAVILVQLPPSLAFDRAVAGAFFPALRHHIGAAIACEPRHPSWFGPEAEDLLVAQRVARVAADPVLASGGERPGGWTGLRYHRLHGAPSLYRSSYDEPALRALASALTGNAVQESWCVFDNTASGAATANALSLRAILEGPHD